MSINVAKPGLKEAKGVKKIVAKAVSQLEKTIKKTKLLGGTSIVERDSDFAAKLVVQPIAAKGVYIYVFKKDVLIFSAWADITTKKEIYDFNFACGQNLLSTKELSKLVTVVEKTIGL